MNPTMEVRRSSSLIMEQASHVHLGDTQAFEHCVDKMIAEDVAAVQWDEHGWHFSDDITQSGEQTAQYVLVLDALNFCFWPSSTSMEYDHLASSLTHVLREDPSSFSADNLSRITSKQIQEWLSPHDVPLVEERARMLRVIGTILKTKYSGLMLNVIRAAGCSATKLVERIIADFPPFRDETVYRGQQVFFYKRVQILVADLWAAFGHHTRATAVTEELHSMTGADACSFCDIDQLTIFPDYRLPQLLRALDVLKYSDALKRTIDSKQTLVAGCEEEIEIRAATVAAVEKLREMLIARGVQKHAVQIDWWLWQTGEKTMNSLPPHHRVLTCFY